MAFIEEKPENIQLEYPELYNSVLTKMKTKNVDPTTLKWGYDYCVMIDNSGDPTSLTEAIDNVKTKYGISLVASSGKKRSEELITVAGEYGDIPSVFMKIAQDQWNYINNKNQKENNLVSNLDSILKAVGKKGSAKYTAPQFHGGNGLDFLNHLNVLSQTTMPVYPELSDIKKVRLDIYQKYIDKADGTVIVFFNPNHNDCDEWGFIIENVLLATKRNDDIRFITEDWGLNYTCKEGILNNESYLLWNGSLSGTDKALAAQEGQNFTGWKRTKQYRLTKEEISSYLKDKIFKYKIGF